MEIFKQNSFVQEYNHFIEEHPETFSPSLTDFFGINISDYPDAKPTFKIIIPLMVSENRTLPS